MATENEQFKFFSIEGRQLCKDIAREHLPFDPHDYSIDVAARILDGWDVMVRTACAGGKTGTIALIAVLLKELRSNEELGTRFQLWWHEEPIIVVVCPTNALVLDIVCIVLCFSYSEITYI